MRAAARLLGPGGGFQCFASTCCGRLELRLTESRVNAFRLSARSSTFTRRSAERGGAARVHGLLFDSPLGRPLGALVGPPIGLRLSLLRSDQPLHSLQLSGLRAGEVALAGPPRVTNLETAR
jgi:hypothetical protein